jgi:hypothetical protein
VNARSDKSISLGFKWDHDLPYMTSAENTELARLRKADRISFFRIDKCNLPTCANEIIKGKRFCSKAHAMEHADLLKARIAEDVRRKLGEISAQFEQQRSAKLREIGKKFAQKRAAAREKSNT